MIPYNLLHYIHGLPLAAAYSSYSCCPLIIGSGKTFMAEFNYKQEPTPSFPLDPTKERLSMWWIKRKVLYPPPTGTACSPVLSTSGGFTGSKKLSATRPLAMA